MRMCDHWPVNSPLAVSRQIEKHKRTVIYAGMVGEGATMEAVGRAHGTSGDQIRSMMYSACPPFLPVEWVPASLPAPKPFKLPREAYDDRPYWTRPGSTLLQAAREARAEIEASGWFGRRNAS